MLAALALATAISAAEPHWIEWTERGLEFGQIGVAIGKGSEEHLLLMVTADGCAKGMRVYDGRYGEAAKAVAMMEHSRLCDRVELRRSWFDSVYAVQQFISGLPYALSWPH